MKTKHNSEASVIDFSTKVINHQKSFPEYTLLESINFMCETMEIEVTSVNKLLSPKIRALLENECAGLRLLKNHNREAQLEM